MVGTTAWLADLPKVTKWVMENDTALFYASNFSLGVNIFFKINTLLANLLKQNADYQIALTEIHHTAKVDKPSGTAVELANSWTKPTSRFDSWTLAAEKSENQLFIDAQRAENVVGTHIINANSAIDQITISHVAHSRQGFAQGALVAASWLQDKKGIFNMENLLNS